MAPSFCLSAAKAETVTGTAAGSAPTNLDLSSVTASMASKNKSPVNIQVGGSVVNGKVTGGSQVTILPGQFVTPAQYAAIFGAMRGSQTLLLDPSGAAAGGSLNLSSKYVQNLSGLSVPGGVQINAIGYNTATPLNVMGNLNITGSMYTLQNAPNIMSVLNMGNLNIGVGGLLSGYLPAGMSIAGLYSSAGMRLNVAGNVLNQGTITTPGALNIIAGGTITNQSINNVQAVMAAQNINLATGVGNIYNSGLIQAMNSLNINTISPNVNLNINNTSGVLQALGGLNPLSGVLENGIINLRDDGANLELANISITGGKLDAEGGINMFGKNMEVHVDSISGPIANKGSVAHVDVKYGTLTLGRQILSGDPSYYNNAGDIIISDLTSVAGDLAIVASGSIITTGATTITASAGNTVFLGAGLNFSIGGGSNINSFPANDPGDSVNVLTFDGTTNVGGNINASGSALNINTSGSPGNPSNITLVATGSINIGSGNIDAKGNGSVLIIEGTGFTQTSTGAGTIPSPVVGVISTKTGDITIASAAPVIANGTTITDGTLSAFPTVGTATNGVISAGQISSTSGNISITSNGNITLTRSVTTGGTGDLTINTGANLSAESYITPINNKLVTINVPLTVDTGALNITATGNIKLDSFVSNGSTVAINGGSINIAAASGSALDTTSITATTDDITNQDFVSSGNLTLSAPNGFIGAADSAFFTSSPILQASAKENIRILDSISLLSDFKGTSTTGSLFLQTTGDVVITSDLSAPTGVSLILFAVPPLGVLTMNGNKILTTNGPVLISANEINFGGTTPINAGTGAVTILPVSPLQTIHLGTGTGGLDFSEAVLNGIVAGSLTIGSASTYGDIIVGGASLNLTAGYDLHLLQGDGLDNMSQQKNGIFNSAGIPINIAGSGGAFTVTTTKGTISTALITNNSTTNAQVILQTGSADITLDGTNAASLPIGHDIRVIAGGTAAVNGLGTGPLVVQPVRQGNDGGNFFIRSNNLLTATGPSSISIDVSALGANGNGGIASVERTATGALSATPGVLLLNISGGSSTGDQGTAVISNNGDLTVDIGAGSIITSTGTSTNGGGPSFTFTAGSVGAGKLLITSSLNSNGIGTGNGGSISLNSNSTTAFLVGVNSSTNTNGIRGTFSVLKGSGGTTNGDITLSNHGGGITNKVVDLSVARNLTLDTSGAKAGTLSVFSMPISAPGMKSLNITAGGTATIVPGTQVLTADSINLRSEKGAITAKIDTDTISANTGTSGTASVNLTSAGTTPITLLTSSAMGTFSLTHAGDINTSGDVTASSVTLKSTGTNNNSIFTDGNVIANGANGKVTLTATGSGTITDSGFGFIQGVNLVFNSGSGNIGTGGIGVNGALLIATANLALNSTGVANIKNLNGANMIVSSAKTTGTLAIRSFGGITFKPTLPNLTDVVLTTSASNGDVVMTGSLGNTTNTNSISITTNGGDISGNGTLFTSGTGSVTLSAGTVETESNIGSSAPLKVNTPTVTVTTTKGLINLSSLSTTGVTVGNLQTAGVLKYTSVGPSTFGTNVTGSSVTLKLVGANNFTGSISSTDGALSLTQTGAGLTNISTALSTNATTAANGNMTISGAGPLTVGNTTTVDGNLSVRSAGTINFADNITASGTATITQTAAGGDTFKGISGTTVTLSLKPDLNNVQFNGDITATTGAVRITETGTLAATTTFATGADITAKTTVNVATVGAADFRGITSGNGSSGNTTVSTKGSSNFFGAINAKGSGIISLTQTGGAGMFIEGGIAEGASFTASNSGTGGIVHGATSIIADTTVTLKNTNSTTNAGIDLGGNITVSPSSGTVNLTSTGSGSFTQGAGSVSAKTVNFTSGTGAIGTFATALNLNTTNVAAKSKGLVNINNTNPGTMTLTAASVDNATFKLTSAGNMVINPTLAGATAIELNSTGNLTLKGGTLGSTAKTTGLIFLNTTTGDITGASTLSTSNTGSVTLASTSGDFGTSTAALRMNTTKLNSANTTGIVNLSNSNKDIGGNTYGAITGSDVKITTASNSTFSGNITTSGTGNTGNIKITQSAGVLTLGPGVYFHAQGDSAQITLQEKADVVGAGINLQNGVILETDVPSLVKTSGPLSFPRLGQITLVVGGTIPVPSINSPPTGIKVNSQPNDAYFGTNPGTIAATNSFVTINGNTAVQMQSGKKGTITLTNVNLDADPPVAATAPVTAVRTVSLSSNNAAAAALANPETRYAVASAVSNIYAAATPQVLFGSVTKNDELNKRRAQEKLEERTIREAPWYAADDELPAPRKRDSSAVVISSDRNLGLAAEHSADLKSSAREQGGRKVVSHQSGAVVFAPFSDMTVETPHGNIEIAAKSLVLITATKHGTSVFNLDDEHLNAVVIRDGKRRIYISPGRQVTLTQQGKNFEDVNGAEEVGYRNIKEFNLQNGVKGFGSEFSIPSAVIAFDPLKKLFHSKHPDAVKLSGHLRKTIAIMLQINKNADRFQQVLSPRMAAYSRE